MSQGWRAICGRASRRRSRPPIAPARPTDRARCQRRRGRCAGWCREDSLSTNSSSTPGHAVRGREDDWDPPTPLLGAARRFDSAALLLPAVQALHHTGLAVPFDKLTDAAPIGGFGALEFKLEVFPATQVAIGQQSRARLTAHVEDTMAMKPMAFSSCAGPFSFLFADYLRLSGETFDLDLQIDQHVLLQ